MIKDLSVDEIKRTLKKYESEFKEKF